MAGIWTIIVGLIFMVFFKMGFWGFLLGLFVGPYLYNLFNRVAPLQQNVEPDLYLKIAFEVLGHLGKAKGKVTQDDIQIANAFMDRLNLSPQARSLARASFNTGKDTQYPLRQRLQQLYAAYRTQRNILGLFIEQVVQMALADGQISPEEEAILLTVADELHMSRTRLMLMIQMIMASSQFQRQYQNQSSSSNGYYRQQNRYQQAPNFNRGPSLQDAYQVLGVKESDDNTTIKRAYRKLMNEHHPDKLVSKGLPKEMLEAAKQRVQEIQAAYDLIKSRRGFK